jgi:membrane protease YdiL (CAAX protease family)
MTESATQKKRVSADGGRSLALMFAIGAVAFFALPAEQTTHYFFAAPYYLLPFAVLAIVVMISERLHHASITLTAWASATTVFCYGCFEVIYSWLPNGAALIPVGTPAAAFWQELINYCGNRSLQLIPIALLALIMAKHLKGNWQHRLKIGNLSAETRILGEKQPMPWSKVVVRIFFYFMLVTVGFIVSKGVGDWTTGHSLTYAAKLAGGAANSLVEELLFRGLLMPVFELVLAPGAANLLQAIFFSIIHYGFIESFSLAEVLPELVKLIAYVGIGLFLGRAARETEGLLIPWLFHFIITSAIWLTIVAR